MYHSGGDVDTGGGYTCGGSSIWEISVPLAQYYCGPKTALKTLSLSHFLKADYKSTYSQTLVLSNIEKYKERNTMSLTIVTSE